MVLQALADAGQVMEDVDADLAEMLGVADTGQLQQVRRVDGAAAEDDLGAAGAAAAAAA